MSQGLTKVWRNSGYRRFAKMYLAPASSSQSTHRYNKRIVHTCSYLLTLCLFYPTTDFVAETKTAAGLQHKLQTLQEVVGDIPNRFSYRLILTSQHWFLIEGLMEVVPNSAEISVEWCQIGVRLQTDCCGWYFFGFALCSLYQSVSVSPSCWWRP